MEQVAQLISYLVDTTCDFSAISAAAVFLGQICEFLR